jgi:hypothetical protein
LTAAWLIQGIEEIWLVDGTLAHTYIDAVEHQLLARQEGLEGLLCLDCPVSLRSAPRA